MSCYSMDVEGFAPLNLIQIYVYYLQECCWWVLKGISHLFVALDACTIIIITVVWDVIVYKYTMLRYNEFPL